MAHSMVPRRVVRTGQLSQRPSVRLTVRALRRILRSTLVRAMAESKSMRTHLQIISGEGVTRKIPLFGSKSASGVYVVVKTQDSADPIALDRTDQPLGHVTAPDQAALWQELTAHPKRIRHSPHQDFIGSAGIAGEAIWFDLDST
jgi:hypothetical protein